MKSNNTKPIFVVGVPRSGTTLLSAMLAAHSRLSCGPETYFFSRNSYRHLLCRQMRRSWPDRVADELLGAGNPHSRLADAYGLSREELISYLRHRRPTVANVLAALTEQFMYKMGKKRWVEKTPRHLLHLDKIHKYFPQSPVIRIVRDPRDAALSILKAPWGFDSFLQAMLYWQYLDARSNDHYVSNPYTHTVRYEDLVQQPERELRRICDFIGEEYETGMLDTSESSRQVTRTDEPWKQNVGQPIDTTRIYVWRRQLSDSQKLQTEAILGDRLKAFGYPTEFHFERYVEVFPKFALACYPDLLANAVSRRVRFWPSSKGEKPEDKIYVGHPEADHWLGDTSLRRLFQVLSIAVDLLGMRLSGQTFHWVNNWETNYPSSYCSILLSLMLRSGQRAENNWPLGTRVPFNAWL